MAACGTSHQGENGVSGRAELEGMEGGVGRCMWGVCGYLPCGVCGGLCSALEGQPTRISNVEPFGCLARNSGSTWTLLVHNWNHSQLNLVFVGARRAVCLTLLLASTSSATSWMFVMQFTLDIDGGTAE